MEKRGSEFGIFPTSIFDHFQVPITLRGSVALWRVQFSKVGPVVIPPTGVGGYFTSDLPRLWLTDTHPTNGS
jgi:hypothetical protein